VTHGSGNNAGTTGVRVCNGSAGLADKGTDWTLRAHAEARARKTTTHLWRGLTDTGAASGLPTGGRATMAAVLVTVLGLTLSGWRTELLAFTVMVAGLLLTRGRVPSGLGTTMPAACPGVALKKL
jgi:hypothetical protein